MSNCVFEVDAARPGHIICRACRRGLRTNATPERWPKRNCVPAAIPSRQPVASWVPRDEDGEPLIPSQTTWEDLPCEHRGDVLRIDECDTCIDRGQPFEVRACDKHGECSIIRRKKSGRLRDCYHCRDRTSIPVANPGLVQLDARLPVSKQTGPVRVCILTPDCGAGGVERWIADLSASLPVDLARVVSVAIVRDGQKWDPICHEIARTGATLYGTRGVKWGHKPGSDCPVTWCDTDAEVLRRSLESVDVVVSWGITSPDEMLAAAGWTGPHVAVSHGASEWSRRHLATTATPCRVGVSRVAAGSFGDGPAPRVIWNGSSAERLRPVRDRDAVRAEWGLESTDLVIGQVGRISPEKNPKALALAVAEVQRRLPDRRVRGVLIGSGLPGPVEDVLADARDVAGDAVQVIDPPRCIGDAYAALDIHLLCSPEEGFGLVVTEAMLVGVPQVVTATGIVPEIEQRWPGILTVVPHRATEKQLGDACLAALADDHVARVRSGRQVAWEMFSAARMGEEWGRYLQGVVG